MTPVIRRLVFAPLACCLALSLSACGPQVKMDRIPDPGKPAQDASKVTMPFQPAADGPATVLAGSSKIPGVRAAFAGPGAGAAALTALTGLGEATFLSSSLMQAFTPDGAGNDRYALLQGGMHANTESLIAWGRWSGTLGDRPELRYTTPGGTETPGSGLGTSFHYVIGSPTAPANLPASGFATYDLLGATSATQLDGRGGSGVLHDAKMSVLWGGASPNTRIGLEFTVDTLTGVYRVASAGGAANPAGSELALAAGASSFSGNIGVNASAGPCTSVVCRANIDGFFVGDNAQRAGVSYSIGEGSIGNQTVIGAAAFKLAELAAAPPPVIPPPPPVIPLAQPGPFRAVVAGGPQLAPFGQQDNATATQAANGDLTRLIVHLPTDTNVTPGTTTSADTGGDGTITWGRWTNGTINGTVQVFFQDPSLPENTALHYVIGVPTAPANIPVSGTATFNLLGATKPTFGDGAFAPGTFTGSAAVQWGGATPNTRIGVDFTATMPGDVAYRIVSTGGLGAPGSSEIQLAAGTASFSGVVNMPATGRACTSGPCAATVSGFFAGPAANRMGVGYRIYSGDGAKGVYGAAAFTR